MSCRCRHAWTPHHPAKSSSNVSGASAQVVVKGRLGLDRTADYLEELRAHSRSRAASVALLSPPPDTDPDDLDHLERVSAAPAGFRVGRTVIVGG